MTKATSIFIYFFILLLYNLCISCNTKQELEKAEKISVVQFSNNNLDINTRIIETSNVLIKKMADNVYIYKYGIKENSTYNNMLYVSYDEPYFYSIVGKDTLKSLILEKKQISTNKEKKYIVYKTFIPAQKNIEQNISYLIPEYGIILKKTIDKNSRLKLIYKETSMIIFTNNLLIKKELEEISKSIQRNLNSSSLLISEIDSFNIEVRKPVLIQ